MLCRGPYNLHGLGIISTGPRSIDSVHPDAQSTGRPHNDPHTETWPMVKILLASTLPRLLEHSGGRVVCFNWKQQHDKVVLKGPMGM